MTARKRARLTHFFLTAFFGYGLGILACLANFVPISPARAPSRSLGTQFSAIAASAGGSNRDENGENRTWRRCLLMNTSVLAPETGKD